MASEIRNAIFIASLFPQKHEEGSEKVGSARLREPRDLYSAASLQHPPKWPIECQVSLHYFTPSLYISIITLYKTQCLMCIICATLEANEAHYT
jgi:hypothetical protein